MLVVFRLSHALTIGRLYIYQTAVVWQIRGYKTVCSCSYSFLPYIRCIWRVEAHRKVGSMQR